ncbi:hypothetical protein C6500_12210 [Candidatus Poribacteria bacterium]|nr:MAG: hypothetical protein C6500_12210 [Candidatus Poribacteria bacterium]
MKTLNILLGFLILITLLSGCSTKHIDEPRQSPIPVPDKQESPDVALVNPLTDNPDNPSPHNPLIKKFGDVPEVRTYLRLKQKLERGIGLSIDEAIELYTAEVHLYPTPAAKEMLKDLKADKKRYERLGIPVRGHLPSYILDAVVDASSEFRQNPPVGDKQESSDFVLVNPFTDDPDNLNPHNPFVKKFGDIPEVRTYVRLQQKFLYGIGLNVNEAIELYTAEVHLYPSDATKANLKRWKKDKERYERLGILTDEPILGWNIPSEAWD